MLGLRANHCLSAAVPSIRLDGPHSPMCHSKQMSQHILYYNRMDELYTFTDLNVENRVMNSDIYLPVRGVLLVHRLRVSQVCESDIIFRSS